MGPPWRIMSKHSNHGATSCSLGLKEFYLFNDVLNTFYLWLCDIKHMVKDHSDSERGNPLLPLHELLFLISSEISFICTIPQTRWHIPQPLGARGWNSKLIDNEGLIQWPITPWADTPPQSYISLPWQWEIICILTYYDKQNEWMNECVMTPQHKNKIGYWVSNKWQAEAHVHIFCKYIQYITD